PERDEDQCDQDHEVAAVQARILEERGDPEEAGVGIRDSDLVREEERLRVRLPEPDGCEQTAEGDERERQRTRQPGGDRSSGYDGEPGEIREEEEAELDPALVSVVRPEER